MTAHEDPEVVPPRSAVPATVRKAETMQWTTLLKPRPWLVWTPTRETEDENAIGGLRNPWPALRKVPQNTILPHIRTVIERFLDNSPKLKALCGEAIGAPTELGPKHP